MNNAIYSMQRPVNEPVMPYSRGTSKRAALEQELKRIASETLEIPLIIGGKEVRTGQTGKVVMPHAHGHVLATYHMAGEKETLAAIDAALKAKEAWMSISWIERSSVMLKVAKLISKKYFRK